MINLNELIEIAKDAAVAGGDEILKIYNTDFNVEYKEDESPLTLADQKANEKIESFLLDTGIPILSEEGKDVPYDERKNWEYLWIVDPLDGTKEFVKRNGEFTVNIALIHNGKPILGVIYVPVKEWLYYGHIESGAYKSTKDNVIKLPVTESREVFVAVGSRSHKSPETEAYFEKLEQQHGNIEVVSMGSSLKICLVAEGIADVYPRFAPTMEWDTAAGHAIVTSAGKHLIDVGTKQEMVYNREQLLNNWFIVE